VSLAAPDRKSFPEAKVSLDDVIRHSSRPHTRGSLAVELSALGLRRGDAVIAHTSLSTIGYVAGGALTVIEALLDVVGPRGTLVMPAQTADLTDPGSWRFPAIPPDWVDTVQAAMPAYDPARTPTFQLGVVAELFRTWPGVLRSAHPVCSFAAAGRLAAEILEPHALDDPFGEASPLARLYALDARVLLLGTGWTVCTALHLAERRAYPHAASETCMSPILVEGERRLVGWAEYPHDSERFAAIGQVLERAGEVRIECVGDAPARLVSVRDAVDIGVLELTRPAGS